MKAKTKRTRSAWLLLSVFVSMMMLSALHRHETAPVVGITCADCVHHVHHGHLTKQNEASYIQSVFAVRKHGIDSTDTARYD